MLYKWVLYSSSFSIKMLATDVKTQKIDPDLNIFMTTNVLEAVCKRDWQREEISDENIGLNEQLQS